ncbi:hypothetical protein [Nocardia asteroides]|uniref:hypothetical protein n=1 Tax=Nocardia asteroides TaxID=1824 RepID=UPI001E6318E3|nr:hypothetical protein [Nocardia asteroides]UGT63945.1 hypothetical protein LTT61_11835 [Nocardia asteroides]
MTGYPRGWATAADTLAELDRLITESGVEPSKRVAAARAEIAAVADDERELLAEVDKLTDPDPDAVLHAAADGFVNRKITAAEALEQLASSARNTAKDRRHLRNSAIFRTSRSAALILRRLGDGILEDIAAPWVQRLVGELKPDAAVVAQIGRAGVYSAWTWAKENFFSIGDTHKLAMWEKLGSVAVEQHLAVLRAEAKVEELLAVWERVDELRQRGFVPIVTDPNVPASRYRWQAPHLLPSVESAHSEPGWTCGAVVNGAGPVVHTAAQAAAFASV